MGNAAPLVSVVIPTYNGGAFVGETIDSALRQTHAHREIIVVDDGSTDDTPERVGRYGTAVTYIRQTNGGVAAARNTGIRAASGDYVAFLDHDDVWMPEKLAVQLDVAARHPESGLIVCDGVHFDGEAILTSRLLYGPTADQLDSAPDGTITVQDFYREMLKANGVICTPSQTLLPRRVIERVGLQAERHVLPDHDFQVRIAREFPITLHRHGLVRWRYLASSMSGPSDRRQFVWALGAVVVLRDETHRCADTDRAFVQGLLHDTVCGVAEDAYDFGRRHDLAYAKSCLLQLARLAPGELRSLLVLLALYLPAPLVDRGVALKRALRRA